MWVLADVYEPDVPKIRLGEAAVVTLPCCPSERYEGRIANISDIVDKDTRTLKVRATVRNRGRALKAEMFVKVAIETAPHGCWPFPRARSIETAASPSCSSRRRRTTTSAGR